MCVSSAAISPCAPRRNRGYPNVSEGILMFLHLGPNMGPKPTTLDSIKPLTILFTASYDSIISITHLPIRKVHGAWDLVLISQSLSNCDRHKRCCTSRPAFTRCISRTRPLCEYGEVRPVWLPIYFVPGVGVSNLAVWLSSCAWANMRPPPFLGIETE